MFGRLHLLAKKLNQTNNFFQLALESPTGLVQQWHSLRPPINLEWQRNQATAVACRVCPHSDAEICNSLSIVRGTDLSPLSPSCTLTQFVRMT